MDNQTRAITASMTNFQLVSRSIRRSPQPLKSKSTAKDSDSIQDTLETSDSDSNVVFQSRVESPSNDNPEDDSTESGAVLDLEG